MLRAQICKLIEEGDISSALQRIRSGFQDKRNADGAFFLLKQLYQAYCDRNTTILPASVNDVFEVLSILCEYISKSWDCNHLTFMQCFYHLNCFVLEHNPLHARKLCDYIFSLKAHRKDSVWSSQETIVVANLVHNFSTKLNERCNEYLSAEGENSFSSWLDFVFRLFETFGLNKLYKLFITLDSVLFKVYNQSNEKLKGLILLYFHKITKWLNSLVLSEKAVLCIDKDISSLLLLFDHIIVFLEDTDIATNFNQISNCLSKFSSLWDQREELDCALSCLKLCCSLEKNTEVIDLFDNFSSSFMSPLKNKSAIVPLVHRIIHKFRVQIAASDPLVESRLPQIIKIMVELLSFYAKNGESSQRKTKDLAEIIFCSLFFVKIQRAPKASLEAFYEDVKTIIKKFVKTDLDFRLPNFSVGVSAVVNAMLAYSWKDFHSETCHLAYYCLLLFLKVDSNLLWEDQYFNRYVETWLSTLATSSTKGGFSLHAQTMFIILASLYPKFAGSALKAWATVKKSKQQEIKIEATVLDVIKVNGEEMEKKYPKFNVSSLDMEHLLFEEIRAYSKARDLYNRPVLAVYKCAAKVVKDCVTLANILCCAVDAFSFDISDTTYAPYLEDSIRNVITRLQKLEVAAETQEPLKSVVLCTLGNLFYAKARMELQRIRQKSEKDAADMEKCNLKEKIPVFRKGEKDDLDMTEVTPAHSLLLLRNQVEILPILNDALDYWARSSNCLTLHNMLTATVSFIKGTGYILRLYGFKQAEIKCWKTLYNIAVKLESKKGQILAAAELLVVMPTVDSSILSNVDSLVECMSANRRNRSAYVHHLYRTNYAKNLLLHSKVNECREAVEKIDEASINHFLVKAQFKVLSALLNILQPEKGVPFRASLSSIVQSFEVILYLVQNNQWETFNEATVVQLLVFEVATLLGVVYSDVKVVRSARCYTKVDLNLVQRLALPSRVCELMSLRIWVDLLTWNVTDSELNAQELESMLELGVMEKDLTAALDNPGSPRLVSAVRCIPHFMSSENCDCSHCTDPYYAILVLNALMLRILISTGSKAHQVAKLVIQVGLTVAETVQQKRIAYSMFWEPFSCPVARFYYVVANCMFLWESYQQALHYAEIALKSLKSEPLENRGLSSSIKRLQLAVNRKQNYVQSEQKKPVSRRFGVDDNSNMSLTPENQKYSDVKPWDSTVKIPKDVEKGYFSRGKSLIQKPLFIDEPEDREEVVELVDVTPPSSTIRVKQGVRTNRKGGVNVKSKMKRECLFATHIKGDKLGLEGEGKFCMGTPFDGSEAKSDGIVPLDSNETVLEFGATPLVKSSRTGKATKVTNVQKPKKLEFNKPNLLGTPGLGIFSKLAPSTPAVKVFFDPEGVESISHSARRKGRTAEAAVSTSKRLGKVAKAKGTAELKFGTPKKTPARRAISRLKLDESDEELEPTTPLTRKAMIKKTKEAESLPSIVVSSFDKCEEKESADQQLSSNDDKLVLSNTETKNVDSDTSVVETTPPKTTRKRVVTLTRDLQGLSLSTKPARRLYPLGSSKK